MADSPEEVRTLDDLRAFVHETLCRHENLLRDQFPLREMRLRRGGRDCGRHFAVQGLRSVHLSAVWDADRNTVYFYNARGERFQKISLTHRPAVETEAA